MKKPNNVFITIGVIGAVLVVWQGLAFIATSTDSLGGENGFLGKTSLITVNKSQNHISEINTGEIEDNNSNAQINYAYTKDGMKVRYGGIDEDQEEIRGNAVYEPERANTNVFKNSLLSKTIGLTASDVARIQKDLENKLLTIIENHQEDVITGAVGPQGVMGRTGDRGERGLRGERGDIGLTGPIGKTGLSTYVLYSTAAYESQISNSNISDNPAGAIFLGVAVAGEKPSDAADYNWSLIQGEKTFVLYSTAINRSDINSANTSANVTEGTLWMGIASGYQRPQNTSSYSWSQIKGTNMYIKYSSAIEKEDIASENMAKEPDESSTWIGTASMYSDSWEPNNYVWNKIAAEQVFTIYSSASSEDDIYKNIEKVTKKAESNTVWMGVFNGNDDPGFSNEAALRKYTWLKMQGNTIFIRYSEDDVDDYKQINNIIPSITKSSIWMGTMSGYAASSNPLDYSWSKITGDKTFSVYSFAETKEMISSANITKDSTFAMWMGFYIGSKDPAEDGYTQDEINKFSWTKIKNMRLFTRYSPEENTPVTGTIMTETAQSNTLWMGTMMGYEASSNPVDYSWTRIAGQKNYVIYSKAATEDDTLNPSFASEDPAGAEFIGIYTGYSYPGINSHEALEKYKWTRISGLKVFVRYSKALTEADIPNLTIEDNNDDGLANFIGFYSGYSASNETSDYNWAYISNVTVHVKYSHASKISEIAEENCMLVPDDGAGHKALFMGVCNTQSAVPPSDIAAYNWMPYTSYSLFVDNSSGQPTLHISVDGIQ